MGSTIWTPSTEDVRELYARGVEATYDDPLDERKWCPRTGFQQWLEAHDRRVMAEAWEKGRRASDRDSNPYLKEA